MPTIKEVSKRAGVSVSTVSRVVNGTKYVSPAIEKRVREAIDELDYQPSAFARGLRVQKSQSIGVLIPALNDIFFNQFAFAVEKALYRKGYYPFFCNVENDSEKESRYIDILLQQQIDAVMIVPSIPPRSSADNVQKLMERNIPIVTVERSIPDMQTSQVVIDNFGGGYLGASYLLELGHQHIGVIASSSDLDEQVFAPGHQRIKGIQAVFIESGLDELIVLQWEDNLSGIELGYQGMKNLIQQSPHITAIFALTDQIAVGVYHAAHDLSLSIPDDISVLGYDNIPLASHVVPQLSTVAQPIQQLGEQATELLLQHINQPNMNPKTIMLETTLIERASVRKITQ